MKRYGNQLWVQVVGPERYRIGMTDQLQCDAGDISYANIAPLGALDVDDTLVNLEASKVGPNILILGSWRFLSGILEIFSAIEGINFSSIINLLFKN